MAATLSKPTSRGARSARTRAAILAAAADAFAGSGLAGARTDAIAAAAGVNKAMLYYYFKSKDKLYQAVVEEHFREFNRQALAVLTGEGSARAVLLEYVGLHFDFIRAQHRYACLYQQIMMSGGPHLKRLVRKYFSPRSLALRRLLERGVRDREFRPADHFHAAISIVALIVFYFSAAQVVRLLGHRDAYAAASLERRKQEVLEFIRYGLFANPQASVT
jgi:TetR/AcrR family transcriptional regulator